MDDLLSMTANLYYNTLRNNDFQSAPLFDDWKYKSEPNKAGLLTFKSPQSIPRGDHIRLTMDGVTLFGGQILKKKDKKNDFYNYEALDYKHYLLKEVSLNKTNITASSVVKLLSKMTGVLKWKVGNTKKKYSKLVFSDKTILSILNQLIWLEYKQASNLILFNVDPNANLTFKPYPATMKGYIFTSALDYSNSLDYSDVRSGYELIDKDTGSVLYSYVDKTLQAIWGDIRVQEVFEDDSR